MIHTVSGPQIFFWPQFSRTCSPVPAVDPYGIPPPRPCLRTAAARCSGWPATLVEVNQKNRPNPKRTRNHINRKTTIHQKVSSSKWKLMVLLIKEENLERSDSVTRCFVHWKVIHIKLQFIMTEVDDPPKPPLESTLSWVLPTHHRKPKSYPVPWQYLY